MSPEKGGALRNQSTGGRRLGVTAVICGLLLGAPLLLLQNSSSARASRADPAKAHDGHRLATEASGGSRDGHHGVQLQAQPVDYQAPTTTTSTSAATSPATAPAPAPATTTTTAPPPPSPPPPPPTTTTTAPPPPVPTNRESGEATWYSAASPGYCASPTLSFGTVLTVTNQATGATTSCTVDDREAAGYPRVVDMSPQGFAQIASTSQGVVQVTISW